MSESEPRSAEAIAVDATTALRWDEACTCLAETHDYWLATIRPDGRPHVRPVLAVWVDSALHTTSSPAARKSRNLGRDARCTITTHTYGLDVVVEGSAAKVGNEAKLHRVADAYRAKYGWPPTVRDGAFDAPYGAPTAGPPPYEVYEVTPVVAFGFGTDETMAPRSTRWTF
jgi:nitroimidazol reductase NimA-like FMN-containing flavoprotein (pyridoxamine 5'-phosphate oxidase superfamily)